MPLIQVKVHHGRTLDEARDRLTRAVAELQSRFGPLIRSCEWSPSRDAVALAGPEVRLDVRVDADDVHVSGDIPILGSLLGVDRVKQIVEATFK
jgi:hypothetical protein